MIQFTKLVGPVIAFHYFIFEKTNHCVYDLNRIWTLYEHLAFTGWLKEYSSGIHTIEALDRKENRTWCINIFCFVFGLSNKSFFFVFFDM